MDGLDAEQEHDGRPWWMDEKEERTDEREERMDGEDALAAEAEGDSSPPAGLEVSNGEVLVVDADAQLANSLPMGSSRAKDGQEGDGQASMHSDGALPSLAPASVSDADLRDPVDALTGVEGLGIVLRKHSESSRHRKSSLSQGEPETRSVPLSSSPSLSSQGSLYCPSLSQEETIEMLWDSLDSLQELVYQLRSRLEVLEKRDVVTVAASSPAPSAPVAAPSIPSPPQIRASQPSSAPSVPPQPSLSTPASSAAAAHPLPVPEGETMPLSAKPSFAAIVARHPNPDKAELSRALSALKPPPRPPLPGSGEPDEHLTRTERAWRMKRIYVTGMARLPLSKLKSNLATARIFLSQIFNYSYVGAFTVEFLVAATYAPRFRESMAQLGFQVLDNYNPLTLANNDKPPAAVVDKLRERLFSRLLRESSQSAGTSAFFADWHRELKEKDPPPVPA
jgi:hypothetical protein